MNLGRTLIGAVIGAAVAIGIYVAIRLSTGMQATWFPVVTGLLVGLCVRQATKSSVSYLRGALAALIAAGAVFGSEIVAQQAITNGLGKFGNGSLKSSPAANLGRAAAKEDAEASGEPAIDVEDPVDLSDPEFLGRSATTPNVEFEPIDKNDVWPFLFIAVGMFLAYEFARGTAPKKDEVEELPTEENQASVDEPTS